MVNIHKYNLVFASLIGILLTLLIISIVCFVMFKIYFNAPSNLGTETEYMQGYGSNVQNIKPILDNTREKLNEVNKQILNRSKTIENILKD